MIIVGGETWNMRDRVKIDTNGQEMIAHSSFNHRKPRATLLDVLSWKER